MNTGDGNESSSNHDLNDCPGDNYSRGTTANTEQALCESQARLMFALERSNIGVWDLDLVDHTAYRSLQHDRIFGYEALLPQWTYEMFLDHVLAEDREEVSRKFQEAIVTQTDWDFECRIRRTDGEIRWIWATGQHQLDSSGQARRMAGVVQDITDRKQKEEALRARTEEIETLLQVSPIAIFVAHDPECVRITGNPAGYRMVRLPETSELNISKSAPAQERPTYRTFRNGIEVPPEDLPMQKAARLGMEINEDELELLFEDGSRKFLFAFAKPLFDPQGRSRGAIAAMLDITDRIRIEEQSERNHQRLNDILTSIQDDFYVLDRNWYFVYANERFTSRIGKKPEDFIGNNLWTMFPKHVGTILEENFRAAMEKRETRRFEIPGKYTDAWYSMTAFPSAEGITVLGTDISGIKRSERLIKESEEKFRNVFDQSPIGIGVYDANGILVNLNRAAVEMFGISSVEKIVGLKLFNSPTVLAEARLKLSNQEQIREEIAYDFDEIRRLGFYETTKTGVSYFDRIITPLRSTSSDEPFGYLAQVLDITERKRAEAEVQASQQILETVVNHLPASVALIRGSDLRLQLINPAYQAIALGKEIVGHTLDELWSETGQNFTDICRRVLETGEPYQVVDELNLIRRHPEGPLEPAYFTWSLYRVRLPGDGGWGLLNTSFETTARKQAENALRESEERLRQMIETSPVAIGFGDSTGKIFDANESFYQLTGYSRAEIKANRLGWDRLTAPEYAEIDRQIMATLAETGSAGPYEKEYIRKDSSRLPLLITVSKLPGRDEHIAFIVDMTERKRAEQALAQAMQELQAHIDNSPLAVVSFDREYRITEWSAGAERIFGWRADEVLNRRIADMRWVHDEDVQRVADLSADMAAGRTSSNMHANRNYRKDGSVIECEWYNSALLDRNGKLISVRSQVLDITERKRAEEALRENQEQLQLLNETLEQKVQEKTAEAHHLASDLIKAVQRERHRLSHILHDDLQQRVYAIRMQLTFLRDHLPPGNETAQKEASDIETQLDEILMVTRNLSIDLSPPILRDEGLSHAINWLAARMRQRYGLLIEVQANGDFALADEELHVLLFNCVRELLFNVVKHAEASQAMVALRWAGADLQIEVRDNGKGFVVNAPVQQVAEEWNETPDLQSSSGLATIHHQLILFDGRMEIQSTPGAGTRILLIVPIREAGI